MSQKHIFLESEGDAWYRRNRAAVQERRLPDEDPVLQEVLRLPVGSAGKTAFLEIGCGVGQRLEWLQRNYEAECSGLDPSQAAVASAVARSIDARIGTADDLPFENAVFDVVIFGFCLYLCDREDLFTIAAEAHRVSKPSAWIIIHDFYSPDPETGRYSHHDGITTYKMDYSSLFTWHPAYHCLSHRIVHHSTLAYTDQQDEWVAISAIRKLSVE